MLGVIGILAAAKRLLGVFLQIKNGGLYAESSIGNFPGTQNVLTPNEWNHVAMSVSNNVATFFVNGGLAGGSPGSPAPATFPSVAKLQDVNYLKNTSININANSYLGANNKTFIDKSPVNSTILTTSGALVASAVTLGSFSPYSNQEWSMQVGTSNYLSAIIAADQFAFYDNDFTIEFWAYSPAYPSTAADQIIADFYTTDTNLIRFYIASATNKLSININGTITNSLSNFPLLAWNHIALVNKSNSGYSLYLNGKQLIFKDNVVFEPKSKLIIGRRADGTLPFNGYVSNLRALKGTALYNNDFTPSNQALKLLPAKEVTSSSVLFPFDGSLLSSNKVDFNMGMDNFAVEMWVYRTKDSTGNQCLIDNRPWAFDDAFIYYINSGNYVVFDNGRNSYGTSLTQIQLNTWYHLRFTRDDEGYKLYINGVLECNSIFYNFIEQPYFKNTNSLALGVAYNATSQFKGYISNLRIVKGSTINYPEITIPTSSLKLEGASAENSMGIFNGTYLSAQSPNLSSGNSNFTIECWAYLNSTAAATTCATIFDMRAATTGEGFQPTLVVERLNAVDYQGRLVYWANSQRLIVSNFPVATANWYHIALVKNSNTTSLYVDGLFTGSAIDTNTYNPSSIHIGINRNRTNGQLNGYLSNFRIVTGAAVYTTQFTRPSSYLTPIPGTVLLTLKDPTLKDNSIFVNTLRPLNGFTMSQYNFLEDVSKNYYSIRSRGAGCGLSSLNIDPPIALGSSDYTVEFFIYLNSKPSTEFVLFQTLNSGASNNNKLYIPANLNDLYVAAAGTNKFSKKLLLKTWYHIALVKTYGKNSIFINGKLIKTWSDTQYTSSTIPRHNIDISNFDGYITEYRVVNQALYYIDFVPPTEPLPVIGDLVGYNYSGNFGGSTYLSANNIPPTFSNFLSGAYTIEFWVFFRETTYTHLIDFRPAAASTNNPTLYVNAANTLVFSYAAADRITQSIASNTWYHVALTKNLTGGFVMYINGVANTTTYTNTASSAITNFAISYNPYDPTKPGYLNGYMSNLRISDRIRYNSNFTVPTSPLTAAPGTLLLTLQDNTIVDNGVVDATNTLSGVSRLKIVGNNYNNSVFNPFNYINKLKTHVLISGRNNSIKDYSLFNIPISGLTNTFAHNQNPRLVRPTRTTLLTLTSNNALDASGHITLSAINVSFSAVDPFGTNGYSAVLTGGNATASSCLSARPNGIFVDDDDFTLEFWFYPRNIINQVLFDTRPNTANGGYYLYLNAQNRIALHLAPYTTPSLIGPTIELNKWYHFAMSRKAGEKVEIFLNKKYIGNVNADDAVSNFNPSNLVIGTDYARTNPFSGLISNFRIVKGESLYNFQNEKLFDVPTNDTEIINVNPTTYSQYFDGTSYISAGSNAEFLHGLSSFTIEMWIRPRTNPGVAGFLFCSRNIPGTNTFFLARNWVGQIYSNNYTTNLFTSKELTPINKWSHVALSRQQGTGMTLYVNGISAGFYNDRTIQWDNNTNLTIGASQVDALYKFDGLISNVRVVKNAALYSGATINVPTEPLSLYTSYDLNKYSTLFCQNKRTFISIPTSTYTGFNWGTNSFCVEFFMYANNLNKSCTIFDARDIQNTAGNYLKIERNAANKIVCSVAGVAKITSTQNISAGAWYHIVYERRAGVNSALYINGANQGTYADALSSYAQVNCVYIGASTSSDYFGGCLSNLRISNAAPYNGAVTVPTSNFISTPSTQLLLFQDDQLIDRGVNNIQAIAYLGPSSYITTINTNPFYPISGAKTILLTLQDKTVIDNAGVFVEDNALLTGVLSSENNNPFNSAVSTVFLGLKTKDDFKSYGLSAVGGADYSITNPFDGKTVVTSFLLNGGLYKDSSVYNATLYNTTATQQPKFTNFSPFLNLTPYTSANGGSIYFDGNTSTKFLLVSSKGLVTSFGSKDFTIEFWVYKNSTAATQMTLFDTMSSTAANSPGHMQIYLDTAHKVVFYMGSAIRITSTLPIPTHSWQHIAVTRRASNFYLYINGKLAAPLYSELNMTAVSSNFTDPRYFSLGSSLATLNTNTFVGYMTDIHVVSGQCLYKSEFSPPIEPLSAFANSTLLINATNAGIVDTTGKFSLFTGGTGVYISNDVPAISASASTGTLSAGSMYFDGTNNSYVYTDATSDYFSLSSYTAELWVKPTITPSTSGVLFSIRNTDTDKIVLSIDSNRRVVYRSTNSTAISSITASTPLVLSSWNHIVVTRALSSGSLTAYKTNLYVNGTDAGFISAAATNTNKILHIGSDNNNNRFTGYIDDFKIVKEVMDRYATNVTLPIRESEIHNNLRYPSVDHLEETKLLLNADSSQGIDNNTLSDSSDNLLSVSKTGTVYQGSHTILSPGFGYSPVTHGGSIYLDGSSDVYINDLDKAQLKPFNFSMNYTIEAWVKPLNAGSNPPIFDTRKKGISALIGSNYNGTSRFKGYITGVKASKNVSRYSTNFTVNMIPPVSDQYTSLLLNFNKAGIYDSVSKNNIATIGTAKISREEKKFGAGSIYFDGGGYLAIPENDHFKVADSDFTLEWHMKATRTYGDYGVFTTTSPDNSANGNLYVNFRENSLWVGVYGSLEINFPTCSGAQDDWVHIAIVRDNGDCRVYRNGISQGTIPFPINIAAQNGAFIGKTYNMPMYGYIDEFRFTNGVCRYTSDFPPGGVSMSMLYDFNDNAYIIDDTNTILYPPRYPSSNVIDDYLANNDNKIMVDYVLVGGGGAGGSAAQDNDYLGGGGGGGEFKAGSFLCQKSPLIISIGGGGISTNNVASTKGNTSSIQGYLNDTCIGGGAGGSYFSSTTYFFATSGACGGGSFHFIAGMPQNNGAYGIYASGNTSTLANAGGMGAGFTKQGISHTVWPINLYLNNTNNINGGGNGTSISWPISLSSFCGGGCSPFTYGKAQMGISNNIWGGGGVSSWIFTGGIIAYGHFGVAGTQYTGGGGGGGGSARTSSVLPLGGAGGSGCAIFRVPAVLSDSFITVGTTERITVGDYTFIVFKSSGTLQLV